MLPRATGCWVSRRECITAMSRMSPQLRLIHEHAPTGAKMKGIPTMKFILMMGMKTDAESASKGIMTWPKEDIQAHIRYMMSLNKQLKESGELVSAEGLAWPSEAKLVRAGKDGAPVTDGVFPESKEFLAGYWIIDVESPEQAYKIAARASQTPGAGAKSANTPIEVRPVLSSHADLGL